MSQYINDIPDRNLLIEFLRDRDVECPRCRYNLRNLSTSTCPECEEQLQLAVTAKPRNIIWLILALAPCFFSGIAACFLALPVIMGTIEYIINPSPMNVVPWPIIATDIFGFLSGFFAIVLIIKREVFLRLLKEKQRNLTLLIWAIHFVALLALFAFVAMVI